MRRNAVRDLRRELGRAVRRQANEPRQGARRVLPLVAVLMLGLTAVGSAVISHAPDSPDDPPSYAGTTTTAVVTPLTAEDLRRMRRERERRQPLIDARRYFSALVRPISDSYQTIYDRTQGVVSLRATDREICVQYRRVTGAGASGSCAPTAIARTDGIYVIEQCIKNAPHPQRRILAGAAPDGVDVVLAKRQGVVQASAPVVNNGFVLLTDEPFDTINVGNTNRPIPPTTC
jgi:hypothetical protein